MSCRINRTRLWTSKMLLESREHAPGTSWFATLTYDDDHHPADGSLNRNDGRLWRKRLYNELGSKFRFFFVGEYGDKTLRPHYHAIMFGVPHHQVEQLVADAWVDPEGEPNGFTQLAEATPARMAYCAQYCTKKMTAKSDPRLGERHPEFSQMSRRPALGDQFVLYMGRDWSRTRAGRTHIEATGDVPGAFRLEGKLYPFSNRHKRMMRRLSGLPELTSDLRELHPWLPEPESYPDIDECNKRLRRESQREKKAAIFKRASV